MKKILTFLTLFLMLGGVAQAEIIYLKCVYIKGVFLDSKFKDALEAVYKNKDEFLTIDNIKKTITMGGANTKKFLTNQSNTQIEWYYENALLTLNLINGEMYLSIPTHNVGINYTCEKTNKKIF